jgi:hypothetical protein
MSKNTSPNPLIARLVSDLIPVRRPPSPFVAMLLWLAFGVATGSLVVTSIHWRPDLAAELGLLQNSVPMLLLLIGAIGCAVFAFRAGSPGRDFVPGTGKFLYGVTGLVTLLYLGFAARESTGLPTNIGLDTAGIRCSIFVGILSLAPALALLVALKKKYAVVRPRYAGQLLGAASGLLGSIFIALHCPVEESVHLFVWHFLPVFAISWVFSKIASRVLRF